MKAVVWTGINTVEIQEVPIPKPGQQQVLIQVKGAGLCSTDLHIMAGHLELAKPPHILGHEIAGIIVETGAGGDIPPLPRGGRIHTGHAGRTRKFHTTRWYLPPHAVLQGLDPPLLPFQR